MEYWLIIVIVLLVGTTTASLLWGLRRQAILRRIHHGISTLAQGRDPLPLQRSAEDHEAILAAFDQLASQISDERQNDATAHRGREMEIVLERLIGMLRQPLVAIQSYATLIRQAPEIPGSGDTYDLVQKLYTQITGLLRLFEASTNVSQLRDALSGLEREIAGILPGRPSRTLLLIDEENAWTLRLVSLLRSLRLQVLLAPGSDAAAIMARVVQPLAIISNVGRIDGLGWRSLPALCRDRRNVQSPVFLYRIAADGHHGSIWSPQDIWFWPLPNNDDSRIIRQRVKSENMHYALHGELELATEVSRWLGAAGITVEPGDRSPHFVLDGCVTLSMVPTSSDGPDDEEFILIIPQRLIPAGVDRLWKSVEKQSEKSSFTVADIERTLLESLRPVVEAHRELADV